MGSVGTKVSKEDWNQIIQGLECHPKELESIPRVGVATCCGIAIVERLLVSEAQPCHSLVL